jgi:tetratricopeptide (TPR) repeat protein
LRLGSLIACVCLGALLRAAPLSAQARRPSGDSSAEAAPRPDSDPESSPPRAAIDHYQRGRKWYLVGRYRDALTELKMALEYDRSSPDLLYNVARVYENLGEFDQAIEYYQRYLERVPGAAVEERERTEKTIRRLQGAKQEIAVQRAKQPVAATAPPPPAVHHGRGDLAFWLTASGGGALLGGGGVVGYFALKKRERVASFVVGPDGSLAARSKLATDTKRLALISDGLMIGGGVALTTAVLLYLLRTSSDSAERPTTVSLELGAGRAQLQLFGQF